MNAGVPRAIPAAQKTRRAALARNKSTLARVLVIALLVLALVVAARKYWAHAFMIGVALFAATCASIIVDPGCRNPYYSVRQIPIRVFHPDSKRTIAGHSLGVRPGLGMREAPRSA